MGIVETGSINYTKPAASSPPKKTKASESESAKVANVDRNIISSPSVSFNNIEEAKEFTSQTAASLTGDAASGVKVHVADYRLMSVMTANA